MIRNSILVFCLFVCLSFHSVNEEQLLGTWKLIELSEGKNVTKVKSPIKLVFSTEGEMGKFTGNTSKNLFSGLFDLRRKREIKISGLMSTKMSDDEQSKTFMSKFSKVSKYNLEEDLLILESSEEHMKLKFEKSNN